MPDPNTYTVGWICAITTEFTAARQFLDVVHPAAAVAPNDNNSYTLGRMGEHNVVIAVFPKGEYGTTSAASVARDMLHSFPNIRVGLMVGIGGGAPNATHDIRLGDVVVSCPSQGKGGVYQYDFGKTIQGQEFYVTGFLNQPPQALRSAVSQLEAQFEEEGHLWGSTIEAIFRGKPRLEEKYQRPTDSSDRLYEAGHVHQADGSNSCAVACGEVGLIPRNPRDPVDHVSTIHYGIIASANQLMKDAVVRDKLAKEEGVLCFEMEAAGLMNHFPCLVVRGICDYSDSHKNDSWQGYAAMMAAAYAKDLLKVVPPSRVVEEGRLRDLIHELQGEIRYVQAATQEISFDLNDQRIKHWLSPVDPSIDQNRTLRLRHENSCQWFLESQDYSTAWREETGSFMWLTGISGCGKTVLSSAIIDDLANTKGCRERLLYFYFDFRDANKQSLDGLLRSLVGQLYGKNKKAQEHLKEVHKNQRGETQQPSTLELEQVFEEMVRKAGETWIVLDALNERQTETDDLSREVPRWIHRFLQSAKTSVHLLATGQKCEIIDGELLHTQNSRYHLEIPRSSVNQDIRAFIHERVDGGGFTWKDRKLNPPCPYPTVRELIVGRLMERAGGMFRFVALQLNELENCPTLSELNAQLDSLPSTLDEHYARTMYRIPKQMQRISVRTLQLLIVSTRPLKLREAVDASAVVLGEDARFDPNYKVESASDIFSYLPGLVEVRKVSFDPDDTSSSEILLQHSSVKDFLLSTELSDTIEEKNRSTVRDIRSYLGDLRAEATIAQVTLVYLRQLNHQLPVTQIERESPFAEFSAKHWFTCAKQVEDEEEVLSAILTFFGEMSVVRTWLSLCDPDDRWQAKKPEPQTSLSTIRLYYASLLGLRHSVKSFASGTTDLNAQTGHYGTALNAAASRGFIKVLKTLIDAKADVNIQHSFHGNALHVAVARKQDKAAMYLLGYIDINSRGGFFGSACQAACFHGNIRMVKFLINKGADVNIEGGFYGNALQAAVKLGREDVKTLLLEKAATTAMAGPATRLLEGSWSEADEIALQPLVDMGASLNFDHFRQAAQGEPFLRRVYHDELLRQLSTQTSLLDRTHRPA